MGGNNTKWYRLDEFMCPVKSCPSTKRYDWICSKDRSDIYIAQIGELKCSDTSGSIHQGKICTWRFDCGNHGKAGFMKADMVSFSFAVSQALQLVDKAGAAWVAELVTNVGYQYKRS